MAPEQVVHVGRALTRAPEASLQASPHILRSLSGGRAPAPTGTSGVGRAGQAASLRAFKRDLRF